VRAPRVRAPRVRARDFLSVRGARGACQRLLEH
jgi:hypothetical protein